MESFYVFLAEIFGAEQIQHELGVQVEVRVGWIRGVCLYRLWWLSGKVCGV